MIKPRTIAIGDIHGCYDELLTLMEMVNPQPLDTLVFLGDYVDRGVNSEGVVGYLLSLQQMYENIIFLLGNHEDMMMDWLGGGRKVDGDWIGWAANGAYDTLESYGHNQALGVGLQDVVIPDDHMEFFKSLKMFHETDTHYFVHAGVHPDYKLNEQQEHHQLWIRGNRGDNFLDSNHDWGKIIVHGHTPYPCVQIELNKISIDTGCVFGGHLTAYDVTNNCHFSVKRNPIKLTMDYPKDWIRGCKSGDT